MAANKKKEYIRFSVSLPEELNAQFEDVRTQLTMSRSDAIRKGMRLFLNHYTKSTIPKSQTLVLGTISYIESAHSHGHIHGVQFGKERKQDHAHDHDLHESNEKEDLDQKSVTSLHINDSDGESYYFPVDQLEFVKVNNLQHHFLDVIISTTHIHAGPSKCMIVIAVRGKMSRVLELLNDLSAFKTIENIEFTPLETFSDS